MSIEVAARPPGYLPILFGTAAPWLKQGGTIDEVSSA